MHLIIKTCSYNGGKESNSCFIGKFKLVYQIYHIISISLNLLHTCISLNKLIGNPYTTHCMIAFMIFAKVLWKNA